MSEYSSSGLVFFGFGIKESPLLSTDISCVAVPGRNRTLFCCVFRPHNRVRSAVNTEFPLGVGLIRAV